MEKLLEEFALTFCTALHPLRGCLADLNFFFSPPLGEIDRRGRGLYQLSSNNRLFPMRKEGWATANALAVTSHSR